MKRRGKKIKEGKREQCRVVLDFIIVIFTKIHLEERHGDHFIYVSNSWIR